MESISRFVFISVLHICAVFRNQIVNRGGGDGGANPNKTYGITFFAIIFISAVHVYAVIRKQIAKLG